MPPGNTSVSEPTADAVQSAPLSLEMPTAEEAGADETPVPAQMREPVKEPEPSEKYGVDALEKARCRLAHLLLKKATGAFRRNRRPLHRN